MKKRIDRNATFCILVGLMIIMSSLFVAYSALKTTLTITNGKVNQNAMTWKVGFVPGTVTGVGKNGTETCGTATVTENKISGIKATVTKPGDECTYEVTLKNSGTIDASVSSITVTTPKGSNHCVLGRKSGKTAAIANCFNSGTTAEALYTLKYKDKDENIAVDDVIEANTSYTMILEYSYNSTAEALPDDFEHEGFGMTINFGQK